MKRFLASGREVLVDDACAHYFSDGSRWYCARKGGTWYVYRKLKIDSYSYKREWLHRLATKCPENAEVDHINGNGLDNRGENLRVCSHSENMKNRRIHKNNQSGIKGVYQDKRRTKKPWRAQITCNGKKTTIGSFASPEEARDAYLKEADRLHGEFARAA